MELGEATHGMFNSPSLAPPLFQLNQTIKQVRGMSTNEGDPESLAFACDVLSDDSIKKALSDIQKAWPGKKIGTAVYNASVRKRGPFLEQRPEQIRDGVQASM